MAKGLNLSSHLKRDHQTDGLPPADGVPAAPDPPRPEGEGDKKGPRRRGRQQEWALGWNPWAACFAEG